MERESDQEVRDRQEKARTDAIRERQVRLGHVEAPQESEPEEEDKPKPRQRRSNKKKG